MLMSSAEKDLLLPCFFLSGEKGNGRAEWGGPPSWKKGASWAETRKTYSLAMGAWSQPLHGRCRDRQLTVPVHLMQGILLAWKFVTTCAEIWLYTLVFRKFTLWLALHVPHCLGVFAELELLLHPLLLILGFFSSQQRDDPCCCRRMIWWMAL